MTQSTGCQLSAINKVRFYQRRNIYLILFKVITGSLFFHPQLSSRANLENKAAPNFTTYTVAALQWFYHWRTRRTFRIAFKHPSNIIQDSIINTAGYW